MEVDNEQEQVWYLPHFGSSNQNKPAKIRLVFYCAARNNGTSLMRPNEPSHKRSARVARMRDSFLAGHLGHALYS